MWLDLISHPGASGPLAKRDSGGALTWRGPTALERFATMGVPGCAQRDRANGLGGGSPRNDR